MSDQFESMEDLEAYIGNLESEVKNQRSKNDDLNRTLTAYSNSSKENNLIAFQLEAVELIQRLEHFYRSDYLEADKEGNLVWRRQKNKELVTFNDFGVNLLMETVTKYIDKNTILSRYSEERIYEILGDLGDELNLVIYCNYEKMGMDTYFKKTKFRVTIITTLHMIESAYRRAIGGQTSNDVNQSKIVTQNDTLGRTTPIIAPKRRGFLGLLKG